MGLASRTQAARWVAEGRVSVNGSQVSDPEFPVRQGRDLIQIEGQSQQPSQRLVLMLNKPRGLLTTAQDEQGRDTVYRCFDGAGLPWLAPVGRLDKASEGLLLFSNDPEWAASVSDPEIGPDKVYHVQVNCVPDAEALEAIRKGATANGTHLSAKSVALLRQGEKNAWLEVTLDEGKNRQIRNLLQAFDISVLRLIRVGIGPLLLGDLPKGSWRRLSDTEIESLSRKAARPKPSQPG
jgi:23S rRNA pseudouridine2605 synthase